MYQFNEEEYNARMTWYRDARFGMFLHWGLYSIPARGEWVRSVEQMPEEEYMPFFREFSALRSEEVGKGGEGRGNEVLGHDREAP